MIDHFKSIFNSWVGKLLLSVLPFLIILFPLFSGSIFFSGDFILGSYSGYNFYSQALESGQSIIFNPNNFSGFPTFISSMGFLSPIYYLLFKYFSAIVAFNLLFLGAKEIC